MRIKSTTKINFTLIRHGKTQSNLEKRYLGKTNERLCESGIQEIKKNLKEKKYPLADLVFSSPQERCVQTAKLIYPKSQIIKVKNFREINFGDFEGKNFAELKNDKKYIRWIKSNGNLKFPNGESRKKFVKRNFVAFKKIVFKIKKSKVQDLKVSLVVHGGTIMAILSSITKQDYFNFQVENGSGFSFTLIYEKSKLKLESLCKI